LGGITGAGRGVGGFDEFGSAEALRLNFVQQVVPAGQELDRALQLAQAGFYLI